jgi:hypothetical protein
MANLIMVGMNKPEPQMADILANIREILDMDNKRFEKLKSVYDSYFPYVFQIENILYSKESSSRDFGVVEKNIEILIEKWLNNNFQHYNTKNKKYRKLQFENYSFYYFQDSNMAIQFKLVWC